MFLHVGVFLLPPHPKQPHQVRVLLGPHVSIFPTHLIGAQGLEEGTGDVASSLLSNACCAQGPARSLRAPCPPCSSSRTNSCGAPSSPWGVWGKPMWGVWCPGKREATSLLTHCVPLSQNILRLHLKHRICCSWSLKPEGGGEECELGTQESA